MDSTASPCLTADTNSSSSSSFSSSSTSMPATDTAKYTGRVKWFNNKFGYGFITVVSTDAAGSVAVGLDVFAHHSEIMVGADQYRYLVQGEYVEFSVCKTSSGQHEFQCSAIRGIHSGQLICETRHAAREQYKTSSTGKPLTPFASNVLHRGTSSNGIAESFSGSGSSDNKYSGRGDSSSSRPFRGRGGSGSSNTRGGFKQQ